MDIQPQASRHGRLPLFFLQVFLISAPFWIFGPMVEKRLSSALPIDLPLSSLGALSPMLAAMIMARGESGREGIKILVKRALDTQRISHKIWLFPAICIMPLTMLLEFGWMRAVRMPLPEPDIPISLAPVFFFLFLLAAFGEEIGWQGYAFEPMKDRFGVLGASLILGVIWAGWHLIPFSQTDRAADWIVWQSVGLVGTRIVIAWLYNNSGNSVFAAALFHAMYNVSTFLFPNFGSHYDPQIAAAIIWVLVLLITFLWGAETLARFRYSGIGRVARSTTVE